MEIISILQPEGQDDPDPESSTLRIEGLYRLEYLFRHNRTSRNSVVFSNLKTNGRHTE